MLKVMKLKLKTQRAGMAPIIKAPRAESDGTSKQPTVGRRPPASREQTPGILAAPLSHHRQDTGSGCRAQTPSDECVLFVTRLLAASMPPAAAAGHTVNTTRLAYNLPAIYMHWGARPLRTQASASVAEVQMLPSTLTWLHPTLVSLAILL